jgi:hypothetical protein
MQVRALLLEASGLNLVDDGGQRFRVDVLLDELHENGERLVRQARVEQFRDFVQALLV